MFFGLDMMPKIVLVGLVVFFLLLFNTISGVEQIDQDLLASFQLLGATRQEEFRKVILPACMVWIIGGLKIAVPYALVAATTGEILASRRGIGFLLTDAASMFDMTGLYAGLFVVMAAGLLAASLSSRLERWLLRWRHVAA
jgi:NitT/TauT family transport system permease protein